MRRPLLVSTTTLALLLTSGGVVTAQDEVDESAAGAFTSAGTLSLARTGHTATLLPDGRVLISGGEGLDPAELASTEVWDPSTSMFSPAVELAEPLPGPIGEGDIGRTGHTATIMPDGRALVIGGMAVDGSMPTADAMLIGPGSETSDPAGTLSETRSGHSATFLRDGRVLVVGGSGTDGPLASAELWTSLTKPAKCLGKRPTLFARPGIEFVGSARNEVIAGSIGDDRILGGGGNDRICGHGGDDTIDGGGGNDTLDGGPGADRVSGGSGKDRLTGAAGEDTLNGGKGKDVCIGGKGTDWLPGCNEAKKTRGTVVVNKNLKLKGPHKGRFEIRKNGVTLDCDGHSVTGAGRDVPMTAVWIAGRKGATVKNCDFRDFGGGFYLERAHRNTIANNRVSRVGNAFNLQGSDRNRIIRNAIDDVDENDWTWGFGIYNGSDHNELIGNVASRVRGVAYTIGGHLGVTKGNVVTGNISKDNMGPGFHISSVARGNTFRDNQAIDNLHEGFVDQSTGFRGDAGTDNTYEGNTCSGNRGGASNPPTLCE